MLDLKRVENPNEGLPEDVFLLVSSLVPLVNVDLIIKDTENRILLSWRDDKYFGKGWHVPGSIIRFKEYSEERIIKCLEAEVGDVIFDKLINKQFIRTFETILPFNERGHAISFLYRINTHPFSVLEDTILKPGSLKWFNFGEDYKLIECQEIYKEYF